MGKDRKNEQRKEAVTAMRLSVMQSPAWRALSPTAQALYVWIKLEWRGAKFNNNGKLRLSTRQAAERMGCGRDAAARAFQDLQHKGFIIQTEGGCLGVEGMGKSPAYELTEIVPAGQQGPGKQLFLNWSKGSDFPAKTMKPSNPTGRNGARTASGVVIPLKRGPK